MRGMMRLLFPLLTVLCLSAVAEEPEAAAPRAAELSKKVKPSLVAIEPAGRDGEVAGEGTGFIISADGLIATNTTLDHTSISPAADQAGGLSGRPLRERSTEF